MKRRLRRITGVGCILLMAAAVTAGTWSTNNFIYEPALGARGTAEKDIFDTGLRRVDAHLGRYKTLGDPNYSTLAEALTTIGSSEVTLTIPAGTFTVAANTTMGSNIALKVLKGGKLSVNSGVTLTINGTIEAGPYQIFAGAGPVTLGGVSTIYDKWYATPPATPEGQVAAAVGSRFIKTAGSAPLVFVKESGTGNTGWVAAGSGGGASNFTGLSDTPSSYTGQAGKSLRVNSGANALEFYTPSSTGGVKPFITLGESGYATLAEALTTIGGTATTLVIPAEAGSLSVASNTTIPANVDLRVLKGAKFAVADGVTLTISGPIEAGPYQIFSWTGAGAIDTSRSPTYSQSLVWWGAQTGTGHDIAVPLLKAANSVGYTNEIFIPQGLWRLATPTILNIGYSGPRIRGASWLNTLIYVDVGSANDALTIGRAGSDRGTNNYLKEVSLIGQANCCKNGLVLKEAHLFDLENVNFWLGATEYALRVTGTLFVNARLKLGQWFQDYWMYGQVYPTNGVRIEASSGPPLYQSNVIKLYMQAQLGSCNTAIDIDGSIFNSDMIDISGNIEGNITNPIKVNTWENVRIHDFTSYDNIIDNIIFNNVKYFQLHNIILSKGIEFKNCRGGSLDGFRMETLDIDAMCRGITIGSGQIGQRLKDEATDTNYTSDLGYPYNKNHDGWYTAGTDTQNLIFNHGFSRWKTDGPDGWTKDNLTFTKSGEGQTDTTNRGTALCARAVTNAGVDGTITYSLPTPALRAVSGKTVSWNVWAKLAGGQTFANWPGFWLNTGLPAWTAATSFAVNDGVKKTTANGKIYLCVQAGVTGGAEPAWPTTDGDTVVDGTVKWMCLTDGTVNHSTSPWSAGDVGRWKRISMRATVPNNATSVTLTTYLYRQTGGGQATMYLSEPTLLAGTKGPRGVIQGRDEHSDFVMVGANKLDWGTAPPADGRWCEQGDVRFNSNAAAGGVPGWQCTTRGAAGSTAIWKAMGNLAN